MLKALFLNKNQLRLIDFIINFSGIINHCEFDLMLLLIYQK